MIKIFNSLSLVLLFLITSCALNTIEKTKQLNVGMSKDEVEIVMGAPSSTGFNKNKEMYWKYSLQKPFVGYIPHYLFFDKKGKLEYWTQDMDEYYKNQKLGLDSAKIINQQNQQNKRRVQTSTKKSRLTCLTKYTWQGKETSCEEQ